MVKPISDLTGANNAVDAAATACRGERMSVCDAVSAATSAWRAHDAHAQGTRGSLQLVFHLVAASFLLPLPCTSRRAVHFSSCHPLPWNHGLAARDGSPDWRGGSGAGSFYNQTAGQHGGRSRPDGRTRWPHHPRGGRTPCRPQPP